MSKGPFSVGVLWGALETLIVLEAFLQRASYSSALLLFLVFCLSLFIGYNVAEPRVVTLALFLAQVIAFLSTLGFVLAVGPVLVLAPPHQPTLSAETAGGLLYLFYIFGTVLAIAGGLPGVFLGDILDGKTPQPRLVLSQRQLALRSILLLTIAGSSAIIGTVSIAQLQLTLNQSNQDVSSLQDISGLRQHLIIGGKSTSWQNGTRTISVDLGVGVPDAPVYHFAGYLNVSWASTQPLSFRISVLDAMTLTNSTMTGHFRIPIVGLWTRPPAWFTNDGCTTQGCSGGNVTYTIEWWY